MSYTQQINFLLSYKKHLTFSTKTEIVNGIINRAEIEKPHYYYKSSDNLHTRLLMCAEMLDNNLLSGKLTKTSKNSICASLFDFIELSDSMT